MTIEGMECVGIRVILHCYGRKGLITFAPLTTNEVVRVSLEIYEVDKTSYERGALSKKVT